MLLNTQERYCNNTKTHIVLTHLLTQISIELLLRSPILYLNFLQFKHKYFSNIIRPLWFGAIKKTRFLSSMCKSLSLIPSAEEVEGTFFF